MAHNILLAGTMSSAQLGGIRLAQEPTNQSEGSQRGSISTSQGTGFAPFFKTGFAPFFKNLFSRSSGGSSASETQAPVLTGSAPEVLQQSPFINALQTLVSLEDKDFPADADVLANFTKSCSRQDADDILQALRVAGEDYDVNLCTKDHLGNLHRKAGAPTLVQHLKAALRPLLDRANETGVLENSRSKTEAVSSNNTRKVSSGSTFFKEAFERHEKVIKEVDNFNSAIDELSDELEKNNEDFDVATFLESKNLSASDKNVITDFVSSNDSDPSLSTKVLRLKKNVNPNQDGFKHFIGSFFAKPTTSIKSASLPTKQDIKDAFMGKNFNLAKAIFKLDKVDFTGNHISNLLNKHINDHSHSEAVRTFITGVTAFVAIPIFLGFRAAKWVAVHLIGALAQGLTYALPRLLVVSAIVGLVVLCHFFPVAIPYVVAGVALAALGLGLYLAFRKINALEKKINQIQQKLEELSPRPDERLPKRLDVSLANSVESSRQGSRRVSLDNDAAAENAGQNADADAAAELAAAAENAVQDAAGLDGDVRLD